MNTPSDTLETAQAAALAVEIRVLVSKLRRRFREQTGTGDLKPSQMSVLHRLEREGPTTTSNLARLEGMRPQSMGTVIAPLEAAGLVSGAPDPTDGRQTLLSLTDTCRTWMQETRAARQDWLARQLRARLSPEEMDKLQEAIALLAEIADD